MAEISQIIKDIESENHTTKHILQQLLELVMSLTGRGRINDDYTKTIEFPIGENTIIFDSYYQRVWINTSDEEKEIEDEEEIELVSKEIKRRILQFDTQIKGMREKISSEIFDKPLKRKK